MKSHVSSRRVTVIVMDISAVLSAYLFAFMLRFDFHLDGYYWDVFVVTMPVIVSVYIATSYIFGVNRGLHYYASFIDTINLGKAIALGALIKVALASFIFQGKFPRSVLIMEPILTFLGVSAVRALVLYAKNYMRLQARVASNSRSAILVGAGDLGEAILRQMLHADNPHYDVIGFIDDDPAKWGLRIHDVPVLGSRDILSKILKSRKVDEIVIAIPSKRGEFVGAIVETLRNLENKPELKIAPSLEEILKPHSAGFQVRRVRPSDLLNRDVILLDANRIKRAFEGKSVLVSGAGGTIGSELCRQVQAYGASKIVLLENHATALFYRDSELRSKNHITEIVPVLGDVRDRGLLDRIFKAYRPNIVLHAAAHKHVHQLESGFNIQEGIGNNLLGTYSLASAADQYGAESFLLVSTDKAVRPSSVMGATKRAAELVVTTMAKKNRTRFCAVRFGNVLGSSGSVLRIFQEQIANGGPVTVTDPNVTRYFMTVEESVGLILQSVSMAQGGEVFVLKMGSPVKIIDMAKQLILMSGLEPGRDIEIRVTGLKPGEKMDEALVEDSGGVRDSEHPDIMVLKTENSAVESIDAKMLDMEILSRGSNAMAALRRLQELVPTYKPAAHHQDGVSFA